jgi:hypothetical protein
MVLIWFSLERLLMIEDFIINWVLREGDFNASWTERRGRTPVNKLSLLLT